MACLPYRCDHAYFAVESPRPPWYIRPGLSPGTSDVHDHVDDRAAAGERNAEDDVVVYDDGDDEDDDGDDGSSRRVRGAIVRSTKAATSSSTHNPVHTSRVCRPRHTLSFQGCICRWCDLLKSHRIGPW